MEWRKISFTDQEDWEMQYDVVAYYGSHKLGSLVYSSEYEWQSVINGTVEDLYNSKTEEEAKRNLKKD